MTDQPLPSEGQVDVTESLIEWLRERQAKGIATYGRSLETFNGRDVTRDLREELLDALQYTHQWTLERQALIDQRDTALRSADEPLMAANRVIGELNDSVAVLNEKLKRANAPDTGMTKLAFSLLRTQYANAVSDGEYYLRLHVRTNRRVEQLEKALRSADEQLNEMGYDAGYRELGAVKTIRAALNAEETP